MKSLLFLQDEDGNLTELKNGVIDIERNDAKAIYGFTPEGYDKNRIKKADKLINYYMNTYTHADDFYSKPELLRVIANDVKENFIYMVLTENFGPTIFIIKNLNKHSLDNVYLIEALSNVDVEFYKIKDNEIEELR